MGWTVEKDGYIRDKSTQCFGVYCGVVPGSCQEDIAWSPWDNLTDAREVLERLMAIRGGEKYRVERWPDVFEVVVDGGTLDSRIIRAEAPGPHEGPATCWLAESVLGER